MLDLNHIRRNLFHYTPSAVGSAIFIVLFAVTTAGHLFKCLRLREKFFIPVVIGGFFEFLGYVIRAVAITNTSSLGLYAMQNLLILVAPVLFAATIYMTLAKIIRWLHAEHLSIIAVHKITRIFVWSDVICFWLQGGAASLQAIQDVPILPVIGKWVVVGGLLLQVLIFAFFIALTGKLHHTVSMSPTEPALDCRFKWRFALTILYTASVLILIRNIIRVAEYAQGFDGWIISHEFMLFVFDALPMFILTVVLYIWHPAQLLYGESTVLLHNLAPHSGRKSTLDTTARFLGVA